MEPKDEYNFIYQEKPSWKKNKKRLWIIGITIALIILILVIVIPVSMINNQKQSNKSPTINDTTPTANNNNNNNRMKNNNNNNTNKNNNNNNTNNNSPNNSNNHTNVPIHKSVTIESDDVIKEAAYYSSFKNGDGIENGYPVSRYANLTRIQTKFESELNKKDRIFVIGDIHGCVKELNDLINKIQFNPSKDQLILAGDMMSKGPDSNEVITRARELGAWCVRGNHDDKVIRFKNFESQEGINAMSDPKEIMPEGEVPDPLKFKNHHAALSRTISKENFEYLQECPSILRLPSLNNAVVVHVQQEPINVMTMRHIDEDGRPTDKKKIGEPWVNSWNQVQKQSNNPMTVYYGHDASLGLNLKEYSFGVDSGCVYGRKLSALEIRTKEITQVPCATYTT
ncbi:unnamed protein product [Cunninghamella blakesleeana]